jgi:hypothetical protein
MACLFRVQRSRPMRLRAPREWTITAHVRNTGKKSIGAVPCKLGFYFSVESTADLPFQTHPPWPARKQCIPACNFTTHLDRQQAALTLQKGSRTSQRVHVDSAHATHVQPLASHLLSCSFLLPHYTGVADYPYQSRRCCKVLADTIMFLSAECRFVQER